MTFWIILGILIFLILAFFVITFICFKMCFYSSNKNKRYGQSLEIPPGKEYEPYRDMMVNWMKESRTIPYVPMQIKSFDNLTLKGKYYECKKGGIIELMFHGYRGNSERDLCGGIQRCFSLERNTLIVDQRASGNSDGHVISFGINERKDCLKWIDHLIKYFGEDVRILITGISMGASTVLMTAGEELPKNVIGVIADCGFTSAKDIIKKTIKEMKLPVNISYFFVKLGAKIYGKFNLEETSCLEAIKRCKIPIMFVHGEDDNFVPCEMSRLNYEACVAPKKLYIVKGAGHGLAYPVAKEDYINTLKEFEKFYN